MSLTEALEEFERAMKEPTLADYGEMLSDEAIEVVLKAAKNHQTMKTAVEAVRLCE